MRKKLIKALAVLGLGVVVYKVIDFIDWATTPDLQRPPKY